MPEYVRVASLSDLADGAMLQADADGTTVLLSRVGGEVHATTAFCPHYGAPLATGVLHGSTVVCPWHHAAFDVCSGRLEEPPSLDGLRTFPVRVDGDDILVAVPDDADAHGKGIAYHESDGDEPERASGDDDRLALIVGAGAAGQAAAEAIRESGFTGRVALVTPETHAPYDRTKLSKGFLSGDADEDALRLRGADFYERLGLEVWTDREVTALDSDGKTATLSSGETVAFDACVVATGGAPRRLPVPGADLDGVHVLRSWADAASLTADLSDGARVVVVGGSFIGMESASSLTARGASVTVVDRAAVPLAGALGEAVGEAFRAAAEAKGVAFRLGADLDRIERDDDGLTVCLADGTALPADAVLLGVGVTPATDFLDGAAFRRDDGGLETDAALRVAPGVFAAGDVAAYPEARLGERVRIEHWRLAQQHGRHIGLHLFADAPEPFTGVPFFWTGQFGINLRYVGHAASWDEVVVDGSLDDRDAAVYYLSGGRAVAGAFVGRDPAAAAFNLLLAAEGPPAADAVRGGFDPAAALDA